MRHFAGSEKIAAHKDEHEPNMHLVSQASRIFLYFRWEEREGEKNTSGHSGQLPVDIRTNA